VSASSEHLHCKLKDNSSFKVLVLRLLFQQNLRETERKRGGVCVSVCVCVCVSEMLT